MLFYCDQLENVITRIHCLSIFLKARNLYVTILKIKEWILSQLTTKNYDEALIKIKKETGRYAWPLLLYLYINLHKLFLFFFLGVWQLLCEDLASRFPSFFQHFQRVKISLASSCNWKEHDDNTSKRTFPRLLILYKKQYIKKWTYYIFVDANINYKIMESHNKTVVKM